MQEAKLRDEEARQKALRVQEVKRLEEASAMEAQRQYQEALSKHYHNVAQKTREQEALKLHQDQQKLQHQKEQEALELEAAEKRRQEEAQKMLQLQKQQQALHLEAVEKRRREEAQQKLQHQKQQEALQLEDVENRKREELLHQKQQAALKLKAVEKRRREKAAKQLVALENRRREKEQLEAHEAQPKLETKKHEEEALQEKQQHQEETTQSEIVHRKSQIGRKRVERETVQPTMTEETVHYIPAVYDDGQEALWEGNENEQLNNSFDSLLGQQVMVSSVMSSLPSVQDVSDFLNIIPKFIKTPTKQRHVCPVLQLLTISTILKILDKEE